MKTIVFDIETGPLAESELAAMVPAFDPAEVKTGNIKDPEKVAAKIGGGGGEPPPGLFRQGRARPADGPGGGCWCDGALDAERARPGRRSPGEAGFSSLVTMMKRRRGCGSSGI